VSLLAAPSCGGSRFFASDRVQTLNSRRPEVGAQIDAKGGKEGRTAAAVRALSDFIPRPLGHLGREQALPPPPQTSAHPKTPVAITIVANPALSLLSLTKEHAAVMTPDETTS